VSTLRLEEYVMPAARLGPASPLFPCHLQTHGELERLKPLPGQADQETRYIGYGYVEGCLPYTVQDDYDRIRRPQPFRVAVLENDLMKATFLLDFGGRLWSLVYKPQGRELLHVNPVFQPANMAIRNAWFSGGVEWNFCWIGHTPFTCSPLFAARCTDDAGRPFLRLWEWERVRQMPYQIDAYLDEKRPILFVRVRLANRDDRTVPIYWWSNIAMPERPDVRVIAPADAVYHHHDHRLTTVPFPLRDGNDISYPTRGDHGGDRFFAIPKGEYPWVVWMDGEGNGFYHASSSRMIGRKLWVYSQSPGGRQWQDFLNTPGHPYVELQGGLGRTQFECLPMGPRTEWEWVEAYGPLDADPKAMHDTNWVAARTAAGHAVNAAITFPQIEAELARSRAAAERAPAEILHRGSGWGALEVARRRKAAEESFLNGSLVFEDQTLGDEQAPWMALLETGALPESDPAEAPPSWMTQSQWFDILAASIQAGRSDHWLGWLHLGVMDFAAGRFDDAKRAWDRSIELKPSAWAYRNLAAMAASREDYAEAARLYPLAVKLAPDRVRLVAECGRAMLNAGQPAQWLKLLDSLGPQMRQDGHIRLFEARAAVESDALDRAQALLEEPFDLTNVREGETSGSRVWFDLHAKRIALAEGIAPEAVPEERVAREFPPPVHLDFRMGGGRRRRKHHRK